MNTVSFRTELNLLPFQEKIKLKDSVITIGSCFSDVIGSYLKEYKFNTLINPFGTVYNPISIFNLLKESEWDESKFVEHLGLFFHYDAHSGFCASSRIALRQQLTESKKIVSGELKKADWLVITFGTAFVYRLKESGKIVANCHKVPQNHFIKESLSVKEMSEAFLGLYKELKQNNPKIKLLLTVSPVRHVKDGLENNSVSKSKLRIICDTLQDEYNDVFYFPSYEIMMDDLRDYRFYKKDMIHPSNLAEEYIWNKFQQTYFDSETRDFIKKWKKIKEAIGHKPFNPESEAHQRFLKKTLGELQKMKGQVDINEEEKKLKDQIV
ncbi:GSCFA domain-containing protein [Reichenbachiella sp. MALMAid0571]|uniref:GSCFA domain-containing protein n=1 Tax=Reichenbachiella sp. MALMAid0571 TaxID=3143939 RepID=UPI0032DED794